MLISWITSNHLFHMIREFYTFKEVKREKYNDVLLSAGILRLWPYFKWKWIAISQNVGGKKRIKFLTKNNNNNNKNSFSLLFPCLLILKSNKRFHISKTFLKGIKMNGVKLKNKTFHDDQSIESLFSSSWKIDLHRNDQIWINSQNYIWMRWNFSAVLLIIRNNFPLIYNIYFKLNIHIWNQNGLQKEQMHLNYISKLSNNFLTKKIEIFCIRHFTFFVSQMKSENQREKT